MKDDYYSVVIDMTSSKSAFYMYGINWVPDRIVDEGDKDGYIVQKVKFKNNSNLEITKNNIKDVEYLEAWKVQNKKVIRNINDDCDDLFSCGSQYDMISWIIKSLGENGYVEYITEVYWIDIKNPLYRFVDSWEESSNSNRLANGLKSILYSDCKSIWNVKPKFVRDKFIHKINFSEEKIIKEEILKFCNNWPNKKDFEKSILDELPNESKYRKMIVEMFKKSFGGENE